VIGDSLSDPAVGGGGYIGYVRERCPALHVDNRARGGFMVNQMRRRLLEELAHGSAAFSHAVVFGGVNDLYSDLSAGRSLERIQSDLSKIYGELKARGVFVIAMTVAPWSGFKRYYTELRGERTRQLNAWIFEQQRSGAVDAVIDAHGLLACGTPAALCPELAAPFNDGLHFGRLGQRRLGEALYEAAFSGCTAP
jgi:lysophospholipase L1-like esterase